MTQDEIIRMAREAAQGEPISSYLCNPLIALAWSDFFERFATIVAAHEREKHLNIANEVAWSVSLAEREACAKVCEEMMLRGNLFWGEQCAADIRARGNE